MRVIVIGDIGIVGRMIHLGDEAMFEQLTVEARSRSVDVVALSANPESTREAYGVEAISPIGFAFQGADARKLMRERSERVLAQASGTADTLATDDPARAVIDAIRTADGVIVAGGGNVASNWPHHIWERATLAALAEQLGKPFAISGQTLGPALIDEDAPIVAAMLRSARVVGVRESASHAVAQRLGVSPERLQQTIDDASFLGIGGDGADRADQTAVPYCLVSFSLHLAGFPRAQFVERTAHLLDAIRSTAGLEIAFLAHFGSIDPGVVAGDSALHAEIAQAMASPSRVVLPTSAVDAARLARSAALVISSRYHPAVFAASAGVPTLAIAVDDYTEVKLTGALGNIGQTAVFTLEASGDILTDAAVALWRDRDAIRATAQGMLPAIRAASDEWWDRLFAALADV